MPAFRTQIRRVVLKTLWVGALRRYAIDHPLVIAIGGSVGKTSTKEAVALMLQEAGLHVIKTQGNMATDFGVALSILGCNDTPNGVFAWLAVFLRVILPYRKKADYYVLEYSSDALGDTEFLTSRIPPHIAILTTLVPVHMEQYQTEEIMVEETVRLIDAVSETGLIIANADDALQKKALTKKRVDGRGIWWYGIAEKQIPKNLGVWASEIVMRKTGLEALFTIISSSSFDALNTKGRKLTAKTHVLGEYQLSPLLAAAAVGQSLHLPLSAMKQGLEKYELPNGRGRLIAGRNDMTIIDDTANASPEAVKAGLSLMKPYAGDRRRVAILGTMNELGEESEAAHTSIAQMAAKTVSSFVAIGKYAPLMVEAAQKAGMAPGSVIGFATPEHLLGHLSQVVQRNDVIYIKASQNGMRLERVVKALMAEPEKADQMLVRQGAYWQTH